MLIPTQVLLLSKDASNANAHRFIIHSTRIFDRSLPWNLSLRSHGTTEAGCITTEGKLANIIDLAYSSDASMLVLATEDKHLRLHRTTKRWGGGEGARKQPGSVCNDDATELGQREIPKKPTRVLFSPTPDGKEVGETSDCAALKTIP